MNIKKLRSCFRRVDDILCCTGLPHGQEKSGKKFFNDKRQEKSGKNSFLNN